ncbi:general substrate transporter [Truncatella angustata]|uniref:General substrate transporter n=1 Tax=Truncatella angustata TaxID=152316 RepID=A0A9P8ZW31_9PEZI|nr:general substrate transporter [Truncatella angustata]KAH6652562.1 general substrate transporter [Truncatella angustata]
MAPSLFDKFRYFNRNLALAVTLVAVSTFNYGFDNQAFATTQSMEPFIRQFGVYNETSRAYELEAYWLSLFSSLNYIGFAFGVVIGSMVSARWGRRWCMFSMSCYALVTATIAVTSQTREQIMAARILNYIYVGMELSVIPTFQSELVPAAARGFIVGSYQFSLLVGGLVINSVCYGTARRFADNRAWRIPIGLFYIVPTIVGSLVLFIPESPRWLLRKNRIDEAKASLRKLRESAFTQDEIESEFAELRLALEQEQEQGRFRELFDKHNIKRTLIVIGVNFFQQATGQAFASQYGAIYVRSLGTINPQLFSLINSCISLVPMTATLFLTDRIGRRSLLMLSSVAMLGCLFAMGGLGVQSPVSTERKRGIVGMLSLFGVSFATGWGPLTYVVATEVSALRLRDQTARLGFGVNVVINFAVNFMIPYLISDSYVGLGSKVGFIFGCMAVLSFIFTYYAVPECKGKSLEQIDLMLKNGVRLRDFGKTGTTSMMHTETHFVSDKARVHADDQES